MGVGVRRVGDWQAIVLSIVTIISGISSVRWLVDCNMYHGLTPILPFSHPRPRKQANKADAWSEPGAVLQLGLYVAQQWGGDSPDSFIDRHYVEKHFR